VQISIYRVVSEKPAAQKRENVCKKSLGNYESAALPAELLWRASEAEDDTPARLGQGAA
jgi:hypothetical protein